MKNKLFIIGDSHVRAFGYNNAYVPLFIGPAAFNNFRTAKSAEVVTNKIVDLLINVKEDISLMLLFVGDVEHATRHVDTFSDKEWLQLDESITRYQESIKILKEKFFNIKLIVSSVLPGRSEQYRKCQEHYNKKIKSFCSENNIHYIDVNDRIVNPEGFLVYPYKADFAHINYRVPEIYYRELISMSFFENDSTYYSDYKWSHVYNIDTTYGPVKIWGDIYRDELIVNDYETISLDRLQKSSIQQTQSIKKIAEICSGTIHENEITIANCQEGFLAFELMKINNFKINAWDFDLEKINNAKLLGTLGKNGKVDFYTVSAQNKTFEFRKVVIDFEQYKFKEEVRLEILSEIKKQSAYLFMLSENVKSDTRILNKIGFEYIYELADDNYNDKKLILASSTLLNGYQNILKKNNSEIKKTLLHRLKEKFLM